MVGIDDIGSARDIMLRLGVVSRLECLARFRCMHEAKGWFQRLLITEVSPKALVLTTLYSE